MNVTGKAKTAAKRCLGELPFYEELDDLQFETLCTAVLNLNPILWTDGPNGPVQRRVLRAERLGGGADQKGADIRAYLEGGEIWMFQCKLVRTFGPTQVAEAVERAEKGFPEADRYVLVTSLTLTLPAQTKLNPKWEAWDAARLTELIQRIRPLPDAVTLVSNYFAAAEVRRVLPWGHDVQIGWKEHFAPDLKPGERTFHHRSEWIPIGGAFEAVERFARNGAGRALILSAPGGQGKSRLLLELARRVTAEPGPVQVRFLNLRSGSLAENDAELLAHESEPTVLIIDDAHRLVNVVREVARATSRSASTRLLLVTRPAASAQVRSELYAGGYEDRIDRILVLPKWTKEAIQALADQALGGSHSDRAVRLAELAQRSPLLVVLGAALLKRGDLSEGLLGDIDFRERVFRGFRQEFLECQPGDRRPGLEQLINLLSLLSPVPVGETLRGRLAEILECPVLKVAEDLDSLQASGLVVENREGIRLYPDLFADAVLVDAVLNEDGEPSHLGRAWIERLNPDEFPSLLRNLGMADWEGRRRGASGESVLEVVWQRLRDRFIGAGWDEREKLLLAWLPTTSFQPKRTLELARLVFNSPEATGGAGVVYSLQDAEPLPGVSGRDRWVGLLREAGAILEPVVVWHPVQAGEALDLLWDFGLQMPVTDRGPHRHPYTHIAQAASFGLHNPLAAAKAVLDCLERKLTTTSALGLLQVQPWMLAALLGPFFGRSVEENWISGRTIHSRTWSLDPGRIRPLRRRALDLLSRCLESGDEMILHAALPVLGLAIERIRTDGDADISAKERASWHEDRLEALELVRPLLIRYADYPIALFRLRKMLRLVSLGDADAGFSAACLESADRVPDTFPLRLVRVLVSTVHEEETNRDPGEDFETWYRSRCEKWNRFQADVAREAVAVWPEADGLIGGIAALVRRAREFHQLTNGRGLAEAVANISPIWAENLLLALLTAPETEWDDVLAVVLARAQHSAPSAYAHALTWLPKSGSPPRLAALVQYLALRLQVGPNLSETERAALYPAAVRSETSVVAAVADLASRCRSTGTEFGSDLLRRLRPVEEEGCSSLLRALDALIECGAGGVDAVTVTDCLRHLTDANYAWLTEPGHVVANVTMKFPLPAYLNLAAQVDAGIGPDLRRLVWAGLRLGQIEDADFVDGEIGKQFGRMFPSERPRGPRLALVRALVFSDGIGAMDRQLSLIRRAGNGEELKAAVFAVFWPGRFGLLRLPEAASLALERGREFGVEDAVSGSLYFSVRHGGRQWMNGEPDPEFQRISEGALDLANRHAGNAALARLFRAIARGENEQNQKVRQEYEAELDRD